MRQPLDDGIASTTIRLCGFGGALMQRDSRFGIASRGTDGGTSRRLTWVPSRPEPASSFCRAFAGLLLEYNVRSALIARQIDRLAAHLNLHVQTLVGYRSVTLFVADGCLY
jgi:hypothetical protein